MTPFQIALMTLFREAFEGVKPGADGTWFVQGKEAIFNTMAEASAEQASKTPPPGCQSLAAHAFHIRFAMNIANTYARGEEPDRVDWESSWAKQTVTDEEWGALQSEIRREYEELLAVFQNRSDWTNEDFVTGALAQPVHMAYHLGAMRVLLRLP